MGQSPSDSRVATLVTITMISVVAVAFAVTGAYGIFYLMARRMRGDNSLLPLMKSSGDSSIFEEEEEEEEEKEEKIRMHAKEAEKQKVESCDNGDSRLSSLTTIMLSPSPPLPLGGMEVFIYFGTQTGTAEEFAGVLSSEIESRYSLQVKVIDLEEFDAEKFLKQKWVIFVVATYGEGEPTDNALGFIEWMREVESEDCLKHMKFTVMGLGNRDYELFNAMGKKVEKGLLRLGATSFCPRGAGDDSDDLDRDFDEWKALLWNAMNEEIRQISSSLSASHKEEEVTFPRSVLAPLNLREFSKMRYQESDDSALSDSQTWSTCDTDFAVGSDTNAKLYFSCKKAVVTKAIELRQLANLEEGLSTFHVDLDVSKSQATYKTAENIYIIPENPSDLVDWWIQRLQQGNKAFNADSLISFVPKDPLSDDLKRPFPTPCTLREALSLYCDLEKLPRMRFLKEFRIFVRSEEDLALFDRLLTEFSASGWASMVKNTKLKFREFTEIFMPSAVFEVSQFLQLIGRQAGRPYTISSSALELPTTISITVRREVDEYPSNLYPLLEFLKTTGYSRFSDPTYLKIFEKSRKVCGRCSTFLCNSSLVGKTVSFVVKPSNFKLPGNSEAPIVMIATGAGIAPFRAFLRELSVNRAAAGKTMLLFGVCHSDQDFLYKEELIKASAGDSPLLNELHCAFSRDQDSKDYVTHSLKRNSELVWEYMNGNGSVVYICGSTKMGSDVKEILYDIALSHSEGSKKYSYESFRADYKIVEELWG